MVSVGVKTRERIRPDGESLMLVQNFFVETVLPKSVLHTLDEGEMEAYRAPFRTRESRVPTLLFPRELPIDGTPEDVAATVAEYGRWLATSDVPKLLVSAQPGSILGGRGLEFARTWPNQREVAVRGIHYIQEDSADESRLASNGTRARRRCPHDSR
jgi:haloalkane dehalogenase